MRSRFHAVLAAVALAAAPAAAQTPYQDNFQFQNIHSGAPAIDGAYIGPYIGSFEGPPSVYNNPFDVWCVDYNHHITYGDTYAAWITPLDGTNFSHTRLGSINADAYRWTAYLAGQMNWVASPTSANKTADAYAQDAMWALLGEGPGNATTRLNDFVTNYGAQFGVGANFWLAAPSLGTYADWSIITCDRATGQDCPYQEFIFRDGISHNTEVVPEPVTMSLLATGLAGMALAGRKRRRNTA